MHLHPRTGARIIIRRDIADKLGFHDAKQLAAIPHRDVLAVSTVRTSATGNHDVLVTEASTIVTWSPTR